MSANTELRRCVRENVPFEYLQRLSETGVRNDFRTGLTCLDSLEDLWLEIHAQPGSPVFLHDVRWYMSRALKNIMPALKDTALLIDERISIGVAWGCAMRILSGQFDQYILPFITDFNMRNYQFLRRLADQIIAGIIDYQIEYFGNACTFYDHRYNIAGVPFWLSRQDFVQYLNKSSDWHKICSRYLRYDIVNNKVEQVSYSCNDTLETIIGDGVAFSVVPIECRVKLGDRW